MARYRLSGKANACEQQDADNGSAAGLSSVSHEFILTTVVYGVLSVLRFLEYLVLAVQFYRFLFIQVVVNVPDFLRKHSKRYYYLLLFSVILLPAWNYHSCSRYLSGVGTLNASRRMLPALPRSVHYVLCD